MKDYTNLLNVNSPDYVFIFMPHEFALITAQKYDQSISNYAQQRQIIVVGPSTLIMCMKLVESIWRLEKQNKNSKEVAEIAGGMFDQIAKTLNLLDKTEASMIKSAENINQTKKYIKDGSTIVVNSEDSFKYLSTIINDQIKLINKSISSINMIDLSYESFLEKRFQDLAYYEPLYIKKPYVN